MRRMLPDGRRLGAHLPLAAGMRKAAERAHEIGADAIQIFTDNPTAWRRRAEAPKELDAFRERLEADDIRPTAIHASYLVNPAGPDPTFHESSIELLSHELAGAPSFGARFVNVHVGSHRGAGVEAGTERVAETVERALSDVDDGPDAARLVLENSAGGGWGLGATLDELAGIADAIAARGVPAHRVGFCFDTAHAWGAGIDLADPVATSAFLTGFDARIGIDRLVMVHLNDTRATLGSRTDRHEHLGAGRIGAAGLAGVLCHPLLAGATFYLETPGMDDGYDLVNLQRAYAIAAGEPLPGLPPEAFEVGSARTRTAPA